MRTSSTPAIDRFLKRNYLRQPLSQLAIATAKSETFIKTRLRQLDLVRPTELIEKFKKSGLMKPGNAPANKGKRQCEWMSKAGRRKVKRTQFKKGGIPRNTKADFDISVRTDNRGTKYQFIRVTLGKWVPLHRFNWEKAYGRIPSKLKLVFKDGDTMNCDIKNLELLTPGQLLERNSWHNYPAELGKAVQLRGALNRQINKHLKRLKNEKQN